MAKAPKSPLKDLRAYRESLGENQTTFWNRFGVTQSGGSRYESGRGLPLSVAMLVIAFFDGLLDESALSILQKRASRI